MSVKNVLAISGSTRKESINLRLIKAIAELSADTLNITIFNKIADLPHFNPDDDGECVTSEVAEFRRKVKNADGVLICTPEYAHGVPGTLKNAIDWTISSGEFPQKPTMLVTAATDGRFGHQALLETLKAIDVKNIDELQLVISFAKAKVGMDHKITDENTLAEIKALITRFIKTLRG